MKVIELIKYGNADKAFRMADRPIPEISDNEVLIKVDYSGLNFADVVARRGLYPEAPKNPAILGYDVVGIVESTGSAVTNVSKGDRVTALTRFGGYAEYVKTMSEGVGKLPANIEPATATALATQACTAYYCSRHMVQMKKNDKILVHAAAGGVGSIIVQLAKDKGCTVIATASSSKASYLAELGVDQFIDYRNKDFKQEHERIYGKNSIDYAFDSIGGTTFKKSLKSLSPCGSVITYGAASQISGNNKLKAIAAVFGFGIFSPIQLLMKSQSIIAVNMLKVADHKPHLFQEILNEVLKLADNKIIIPKLSQVFPTSNISEAHEYLESRASIGKVVLDWT